MSDKVRKIQLTGGRSVSMNEEDYLLISEWINSNQEAALKFARHACLTGISSAAPTHCETAQKAGRQIVGAVITEIIV